MTAIAAPAVRRRASRAVVLDRVLLYGAAGFLALWTLFPIYLIALAAFSERAAIYEYPKPLLPTRFSTDTMDFFESGWTFDHFYPIFSDSTGPCLEGWTVTTALAQATTRLRVGVLVTGMPYRHPAVLANMADTLQGVIIIHTAMVLPFIVIVTAGVFLGVSRELEEAATTIGTSRFGAFVRVALPLALPGLAAAAIFTFVTSWNEVFAATILTVRNTTLPAQVLASLNISPLYFRFAGGFFLIVPSLFFIFFMRRYLFNLWGPGR